MELPAARLVASHPIPQAEWKNMNYKSWEKESFEIMSTGI
jgi:hypothetical protein